MDEIHHLIGASEQFIRDYGAVAVAVIIALEALGAPAPGESLLIFASAMAARGEMSWTALAAGAWAGAVVGDNIGYLIGRYGGRALVARFGGKVGLTEARMARVEAAFARYGPATVAFARFVAVLRQLNGIIAGTLQMDWRRFLFFNALGAALWVGMWTLLGHALGEHSAALIAFARHAWPALAISLGAAAIVFIAVRRRVGGRPG